MDESYTITAVKHKKSSSYLAAVVSDSYNIWNACEHLWGEELKDLIVARGEVDGALVVRPDSGNPAEVVVKVTKHNASMKLYQFH